MQSGSARRPTSSGTAADWHGMRLSRRPLRRGVPASFLPAVLSGLVVVCLAASARADWSDEFDGGFSAPWLFGETDDGGEAPATGVATFAIVEAGADDYLRIAHSTAAIRDGGGGASDAFAWVDESFVDVVVVADANAGPAFAPQSLLGILARGNPLVGSGYIAAVDFAHARFGILRSDGFGNSPTILALDAAVPIDPAKTYRIQFSLIGSTLTARLFDAGTRRLHSTISATDASHAAGRAGLLVETAYDGDSNPIGPIAGTFDSVRAVPEPGFAVAVACGIGLLIAVRPRRFDQDS